MQPIGAEAPECEKCGAGMVKRPTRPAIIVMRDGMTPLRSKGYKEGYAKEYRKSLPYETGGRS